MVGDKSLASGVQDARLESEGLVRLQVIDECLRGTVGGRRSQRTERLSSWSAMRRKRDGSEVAREMNRRRHA